MKKTILSIIALLFFISPSFADDSKEVETFINDLGNKIIKVADDKKLTTNQKKDQLIKIVDNIADINWMAKFVLGKNYRPATAEQKEQFKRLYHDFMVNTYAPKFNGTYNGEKFSIASVIGDENYYTAKCIFYPKDQAPTINLDFRVRKNPNISSDSPKFLVFDIIAEGVSLIETQRSEFGSAIANDGLDKFLIDLKNRNEKMIIENKKPNSGKKKTN